MPSPSITVLASPSLTSILIGKAGHYTRDTANELGDWLHATDEELGSPTYDGGTRQDQHLRVLDRRKVELLEKLANTKDFLPLASIPNDPTVYEHAARHAEEKIAEWVKLREKWKALEEKHKEHYAELEALPQLFIAV